MQGNSGNWNIVLKIREKSAKLTILLEDCSDCADILLREPL